MIRTPFRILISLGGLALLFFLALHLANVGVYGWTVFIGVPFCAGALGAWSFQPENGLQAVQLGAIIGVAGALLFLIAGIEGIVCVLLAIPVLVPLAVLGSCAAYGLTLLGNNQSSPPAMALLIPLALFLDTHAKPPVYEVTTTAIVNAAPERVWNNVVAFPDIAANSAWLARTGVAYPVRTRIVGHGIGAKRYCDLSTGSVVERVTIWDEPRTLRFTVLSTPPSMRELGLYGPVHARHLEGYFISKQGQFTLTPLPGGRTLVTGTSWYQHGLWPAAYWRLWSDAIVHQIHRDVLNHIKKLSESGN